MFVQYRDISQKYHGWLRKAVMPLVPTMPLMRLALSGEYR